MANPVASPGPSGPAPQRTTNCQVWKLARPVTVCPSATISAKWPKPSSPRVLVASAR